MKRIMQRIRRNATLIAVGAASFLTTTIVAAPAALAPALIAFDGQNVSYSNIQGTLWRGDISNAFISHVALGDVSYRLSPLSLLTLSPRAGFSAKGGALRGDGFAIAGLGGRLEILNAAFDVDLAPFAQRGLLGAPVDGGAQISISRIVLSRSGCKSADASVWTDVLDGPAKRFQGSSFPMTGGIRCDGGDLLLALSGESAEGSAELEVRIRPDLTYEIAATARPAEDSVASALRVFGFEEKNGALIYGSAGVLRGVGS